MGATSSMEAPVIMLLMRSHRQSATEMGLRPNAVQNSTVVHAYAAQCTSTPVRRPVEELKAEITLSKRSASWSTICEGSSMQSMPKAKPGNVKSKRSASCFDWSKSCSGNHRVRIEGGWSLCTAAVSEAMVVRRHKPTVGIQTQEVRHA